MASRRITMADVARQAGVTAATVSYVINGRDDRISAATRRRVLAAVRETGYQPNAAARALSTRRTGSLGLILSDQVPSGWRNLHYSGVLAGAERACREHGYNLSISLYNLANLESFVFPAKIRERSVDGLLLTGYIQAQVLQRFQEFGLPCVCIGDNLEQAGQAVAFAHDLVRGIVRVMEHLASWGHRRIAYYGTRRRRTEEIIDEVTRRMRQTDYLDHVELRWLNQEREVPNDLTAGPEVLRRLRDLPRDRCPTAVLLNDQVATSLLGAMRGQGLRCPEDLSVFVLADTLLAEHAAPPLSALASVQEELGQRAAKALIDHLNQQTPLMIDAAARVQSHVIPRQSCAEPCLQPWPDDPSSA